MKVALQIDEKLYKFYCDLDSHPLSFDAVQGMALYFDTETQQWGLMDEADVPMYVGLYYQAPH